MEDARFVDASLGHQKMEVGMKIDLVPEGLDDGDNTRHKCTPGYNLEIAGQRAEGQAAEIPEELTVVLEEDAEHFGDGEDDLPVGDIQEESLLHPLAPFLKAFGMARGAEPPGAAGEHQEPLFPTLRTTDAGKPAARVAAVEIALDYLFDDGP